MRECERIEKERVRCLSRANVVLCARGRGKDSETEKGKESQPYVSACESVSLATGQSSGLNFKTLRALNI